MAHMLIDILTVTLCSMAIATAALLLLGRSQRHPSVVLSFGVILFVAAASVVCGVLLGVPLTAAALWALVSLALGALLIVLVPGWSAVGHAAALFTSEAAILYLVVAGVVALFGSAGIVALSLGLLLWGLQAASVTLGLSFSLETLDVVCRRRWRFDEARPPRLQWRTRAASASIDGAQRPEDYSLSAQRTPRVVLQVPCHDEPPDVVIRTLEALAQLDYPRDRYDVMVVDNNTADTDLWEPIADACKRLGFTFLHLQKWPGFKSGALNYALALTPNDAEIIGIIDADYLTRSDYLRELVGYFGDPLVAFVQTPQDYRDYRPESTFYQRASYHAYRYFFDLSMPSRNERNAIIFGGTMGLIRARALREIGGWDEWCITEDAEASLRLLARGWEGRFVNRSFGKGLMPLEFDALKRQRFRWCFGGIQILRKHWHMLVPWARRARPTEAWDAPGLSLAQRYHYLLGGLQWYSDALSFVFTSLLLVTGWLLVAGHPITIPTVSGALLALPLSFWLSSLLRTLWALRATRRCTWGEAIGAVGILWSLGWVVTLASVQGLFRRKGVFLRTPKAGKAHLLRALRSTTIETALGAACWGLAGTLAVRAMGPAITQANGVNGIAAPILILRSLWHTGSWWAISGSALALIILATLQGITYLAAPALCLLSLRTEAAAQEARRQALSDQGDGTLERRLIAGALVGVAALAALLIAANALPSAPVSQQRQQALNHLLGGSNPVNSSGSGESATPTPGSGTPATSAPTATATAATGASAPTATVATTPTATVATTPTATPRPGITPSAQPTTGPRATHTPPPHP